MRQRYREVPLFLQRREAMNHRESIRTVPGGDTALLCMHGILGSPDHFDMFMPLVPETWSIYNVLLDGHGGSVKDFGNASMAKWKAQVHRTFDELCREYDRVVIAAHSMGTLFAMELAEQRPEKVTFLFLLNVPLYVWLRPWGLLYDFRLVLGRVNENDPWQVAARDAASVRLTNRLWEYLCWTPRFVELLGLIRQSRMLPQQVTVPCFAFQSSQDELVSNRSAKLLKTCDGVETVILPGSGHYYYAPEDRKRILDTFGALSKRK